MGVPLDFEKIKMAAKYTAKILLTTSDILRVCN